MRADFHVSELCEALGLSRSGYHALQTRRPGSRHEQTRAVARADWTPSTATVIPVATAVPE